MKSTESSMRFIRQRWRAGLTRMRRSWFIALQMTVAGVGSYALADLLLGHSVPIFAAVAALIAMGFSKEPQVRRTVELALGCTLGILLGDAFIYFLGSSLPVAVLVVFISIMLARFLDPGATLAMQMGLQALLVVMLPTPDGGPLVRSADALIGGSVALLLTVLTPRDPRREPIRVFKEVTDTLVTAMRETAHALRSADSREAWHALIRCRGLQPSIDALTASVRSAKEVTVFSPAIRRHRPDVKSIAAVADQMDLAVRSMRVTTRRCVSMLDDGAVSRECSDQLARVMDDLAEGTLMLSRTVAETKSARSPKMRVAQSRLQVVASQLAPETVEADTVEAETLVLLLRTLTVDLLQATGLDHEEASDALADLH